MAISRYKFIGKQELRIKSGIRLVALFVLCLSLARFCSASPSAPHEPKNQAYLQIVVNQYSLSGLNIPRSIFASLNRPALQALKDEHNHVWQATPRGLVEINPSDSSERILTGKDGLPIQSVAGIAGNKDGRLWFSTSQGAILFIPDAAPDQRWFYFWGRRYLKDNEVLQIVAGKNEAWIRTRTGISLIQFKPFTLEQKSALFLQRIRDRHTRYSYVASCALLRAGDPDSFRMESTDNDGLWTSIFMAAEVFRYRVTHSPEALQNARTSLDALLRLVAITEIPGFPARSLIRRGDYLPPDGEWHWTKDGQWKWKGDTSSDELVGHFFAYWVANKFLPDNGDRARIRAAVSSIAGGLIEHHLQLIGYGGRVTTWGRYTPEYLNKEVNREKALDSVELLSHLRVAYEITGEKKFLNAYRQVGEELGYVKNVMYFDEDLGPHQVNYSDEELAFLSIYPLVNSESDPDLHRQYQMALTKLWQSVRNENNPLWNFIYAEGTGEKSYNCRESMNTMERIPLSTIDWTVNNSQRNDLTMKHQGGRFGEAQSISAIPPNEHAVMKWNGNPYQLDGGNEGKSEDDGSFFLLPYWFGRYYRLTSCAPGSDQTRVDQSPGN